MAERKPRVPIGERVVQAHLEHFCPGGAGVPVTGSGPIGLGPLGPGDPLDPAGGDPAGLDANAARAAGQRCARCGRLMTARQEARRRIGGTWVHEACPG